MRKTMVVILLVLAMGVTVGEIVERTAFSRPEALAVALDADTQKAVKALEGILTQAQADQFETAMLPTVKPETVAATVKRMRIQLEALGIPSADAVVTALETKEAEAEAEISARVK